MSNKKKLGYAIVKCLRSEMSSDSQEDESLEVAVQCLENAFGISADDHTLDIGVTLQSVFDAIIAGLNCDAPQLSVEAKQEAEKWKNLGNDCMKEEKYKEAIENYTKAIDINRRNPVYYCNRAAAYSYLNDHQAVMTDSQIAIDIDPTYSKAYGRLGLALTNLEKYEEAKKTYLKALEYEPQNEVYKRNLELNTELEKKKVAAGTVSNEDQALNMENFASILGNPQIMSMASRLLSNPDLQSVFDNVMSGNRPMFENLMSGNATPGAGSMDGLLQSGQRLAQMMQSSNPELVEQLRQQVRRNEPPPDPQN